MGMLGKSGEKGRGRVHGGRRRHGRGEGCSRVRKGKERWGCLGDEDEESHVEAGIEMRMSCNPFVLI